MMKVKHYAVLGGAAILFIVLLFGFEKVPPAHKALEKSRSITVESTGLQNLINEAMPSLDAEQKSVLEAINLDLQKATEDTAKVSHLKMLSGTWYRYGFQSISGVYAEQIAEIVKDEPSWSIAGTTYSLCVQNAQSEKVKDFCSKRAVKAFESAISIDPDKIAPRINLALCYIDNPEQDNPMKGILMLRELDTQYPDNVQVLSQLARLALKTNQVEKALERMERILMLEPENPSVACLAAEIYKAAGNEKLSADFANKCIR